MRCVVTRTTSFIHMGAPLYQISLAMLGADGKPLADESVTFQSRQPFNVNAGAEMETQLLNVIPPAAESKVDA